MLGMAKPRQDIAHRLSRSCDILNVSQINANRWKIFHLILMGEIMKFVLSVLVAVSIAFLINHFWRKRKRTLIVEEQAMEPDNLPTAQTGTYSALQSKPKGGTAKKVGKFVLLYFAVVFSTSILSGVLGGLAKAFAPQGYSIVKLAVPVFVYIVFLYFLARKYSIARAAKLLTYVYGILIILRVVFFASSGTKLSEAFFHSGLPYLVLFVFSGIVCVAKRSKPMSIPV